MTPPLSEGCELRDLALSRELIKVLDLEKGVDIMELVGAQIDELNAAEVRKQLDLQILYLRRVHAFCFYQGKEFEDERVLSTKSGPQYIRNKARVQLNGANQSEFEQNYTSKVQKRIDQGPQFTDNPEMEIDEETRVQNFIESNVIAFDSNFKCGTCGKAFTT